MVSLVIPSSNAEVLRFQSGETDIIDRLSAADYALLERYERGRNFRLYDLGPGLEYNFFFFNLNVLQTDVLPSFRSKQQWFRSTAFRQAVSAAIDRSSIIRLAYRGRAYPLSTQVTPGNKTWLNLKVPQPVYSPERARRLLQDGGFSWNAEGSLLDAQGRAVSFSILVNAASVQQVQMATLIQADLKKVGMEVTQTRLDRHSFLSRIFDNFKYEAAILALADGDSDPNTEMNVLTSTGNDHVWSLKSSGSEPPWQKYIDSLMQAQLITSSFRKRKQLFDQVQELLWMNMPAASRNGSTTA